MYLPHSSLWVLCRPPHTAIKILAISVLYGKHCIGTQSLQVLRISTEFMDVKFDQMGAL